MKFILSAFLIFLLAFVNGQTNAPFKFENNISKWSHKSAVEDFENNIFAYRPLRPLIIGDDLYLTHNIQKEYFFSGNVTEKLDVNDGELLWKYFYLKNTDRAREFAQRPYFEDNVLKMMIFKEYKDGGNIYNGLIWQDAVMSQVTLDTYTGEKIDSIITDENDTLNQVLEMPVSVFTNILSTTFLSPYGNNFLYTNRIVFGGTVAYKYKLLDRQGHIISDTTVFEVDSTLGFKNINYISSKELSDSLTMVLKHYVFYGDPKTPFNVIFEFYDNRGNFSDNIDISASLDAAYQFNLDYADKNNFIVSARDSIWQRGNYFEQKRYYLFNAKGKFLEKVSFGNEKKEKYLEISEPIVVDNKLFFGVTRDVQGYQNLFFMKSDGFGVLETLKVLKVDDVKDKITIDNMSLTSEGLLVNFSHSDISRPKKSYNSVWMMFENKSIGLSTSTKDELSTELLDVKFYPNPATDIIYLETEKNLDASIFIYDINGRLVLQDNMNGFNKSISISTLLPGEYFVSFKTNNGSEIIRKGFVKE